MSKAKRGKPAAKATAGGKPSAKSPAAKAPAAHGGVSALSVAGLSLAGAVAFVMVCGFTETSSWVFAGLLAGAFVGLGAGSRSEAAIAGTLAGLVGGAMSVVVFAQSFVLAALGNMPAYANPDVSRRLYEQALIPLLQGNWVNSTSVGASMPALLVVLATALAGGVAYGVAAVRGGRVFGRPTRALIAWATVAVMALTFMSTAFSAGAQFRQSISTEPPDGSYAYDGYISLRTYYEMGRGVSYYEGMVRAAAGDARLMREKAVVDGKFVSWATSPSFIKLPYAAYLWRLVAPNNGGGIFVFSVLVCAALLGLSYWSLSAFLEERAVLVPMVLFPVLLLGTVWANVVMTEWWAGLAGLIAVLFALRRKMIAALIAALAASLFREVLAIELVIFGAASAWFWLRRGREREWALAALSSVAGLAAFFVAYALHYRAGVPFIKAGTVPISVAQMLQNSAARDLAAKFLAPASYQMFAYGYFAVPAWVFLLAGLAGLAWLMRTDREAGLIAAGLLAFWAVFSLTIGATSSYWGQFYMPLAMVGVAVLLADATPIARTVSERFRSLGRAA